MMRIGVMAACVLLLATCTAEREPAETDAAVAIDTAELRASADTAALSPHDCGEYMEQALRVEPTRAALRAELGEPEDVRTDVEPNRHIPDVQDSLFTVRYPGLEVELRKPLGGPDMVDVVRITQNRHLARPALGIGAPADRIVRILGEPRERGVVLMRYQCGETGAPLTFALSGDRVVAIELDYYLD